MSFLNHDAEIYQETDSEGDNGTSVDPIQRNEIYSNNSENKNHIENDTLRVNGANEASSSQQIIAVTVDNAEQLEQQRILQIRLANRNNIGIIRSSFRRTFKTFVNENNKENKDEDINFDRNLPTSHSYLGELDECHGVSYQDDNILLQLPLLLLRDFILIPGQTLPLQLFHPADVSLLRRVMSGSDKLFGVVSYTRETMSLNREVFEVGCTAEIRSIKEKNEYEVAVMAVVVQGRQRFKIINKRTQIDGNVIAIVHILSDVNLPDLNHSIITNHYHRAITEPTGCSSVNQFKKKYRLMKHSALSTHWNHWVYRMFDPDYLKMLIFCELREWNPDLQENEVPADHSEFSFWVIRTLPISHAWRMYLVGLNSAEQRMKCQLQLLSQRNVIACKSCKSRIAHRSDVFSMSASGPMAAYVNPGGIVHETLTVLKVEGVDHVGGKTTENSWFPGYAWTILQCAECFNHLGWKFTSTISKLRPKKFWGLTRSSVHPINPDDTDHDATQPHL